MKAFLWNVALALAWAAMTRFSPGNLLIGMVIGFLLLHLIPGGTERRSYFRRIRTALKFTGFFFTEVAISTLRISYDVLTPKHYMRPAVIRVPLEAKTDEEIATLAIVMTLTPGTLALDVSEDRRFLYVHAMYAPDPVALSNRIKRGFERRVLELLR